MVALLTRELREQAHEAGLTCPADHDSEKNIPALLSSIRSIESIPRGVAVYAGRYRTREQEVVFKVRFTLRMQNTKEQAWTLSERVSYLSAPDIRGTEANRQVAIRTAVGRLARKVVDSLAKGF